jgi:tRNA-splicing ligase RtcB
MNWASILDGGAREQALRTSELPFIFPHVALMPDAHWGMGATVGSVIPTLDAIMPAAVGVDIGCGMMAIRLDLTVPDVPTARLDELRLAIEAAIPLSPGKYNSEPIEPTAQERVDQLRELRGVETADQIAPNWPRQLGSLGGGNHFIEVCIDEDDHIWLFLHSGSRGVGNKIAQKHIKVARRYMERHWIELSDPNLAYLVVGTDQFTAYIRDLHWAQRFAYLNREEMMVRVAAAFQAWIGGAVPQLQEVNCHHNYTQREKHFAKDVWLSRKGAIDASEGVWGLIPGSMGAASYVVQGKGNPISLNSSPHGAGRHYSRTKARSMFTYEDLRKRMEGISWRDSDVFLDEHPDAYKDIDQVMADSADLVEVRHTLKQMINVKGE